MRKFLHFDSLLCFLFNFILRQKYDSILKTGSSWLDAQSWKFNPSNAFSNITKPTHLVWLVFALLCQANEKTKFDWKLTIWSEYRCTGCMPFTLLVIWLSVPMKIISAFQFIFFYFYHLTSYLWIIFLGEKYVSSMQMYVNLWNDKTIKSWHTKCLPHESWAKSSYPGIDPRYSQFSCIISVRIPYFLSILLSSVVLSLFFSFAEWNVLNVYKKGNETEPNSLKGVPQRYNATAHNTSQWRSEFYTVTLTVNARIRPPEIYLIYPIYSLLTIWERKNPHIIIIIFLTYNTYHIVFSIQKYDTLPRHKLSES